jgi:hypothetical protein
MRPAIIVGPLASPIPCKWPQNGGGAITSIKTVLKAFNSGDWVDSTETARSTSLVTKDDTNDIYYINGDIDFASPLVDGAIYELEITDGTLTWRSEPFRATNPGSSELQVFTNIDNAVGASTTETDKFIAFSINGDGRVISKIGLHFIADPVNNFSDFVIDVFKDLELNEVLQTPIASQTFLNSISNVSRTTNITPDTGDVNDYDLTPFKTETGSVYTFIIYRAESFCPSDIKLRNYNGYSPADSWVITCGGTTVTVSAADTVNNLRFIVYGEVVAPTLAKIQYWDDENWSEVIETVVWDTVKERIYKATRPVVQNDVKIIQKTTWKGVEYVAQTTTWRAYSFKMLVRESQIQAINQLQHCKNVVFFDKNGNGIRFDTDNTEFTIVEIEKLAGAVEVYWITVQFRDADSKTTIDYLKNTSRYKGADLLDLTFSSSVTIDAEFTNISDTVSLKTVLALLKDQNILANKSDAQTGLRKDVQQITNKIAHIRLFVSESNMNLVSKYLPLCNSVVITDTDSTAYTAQEKPIPSITEVGIDLWMIDLELVYENLVFNPYK